MAGRGADDDAGSTIILGDAGSPPDATLGAVDAATQPDGGAAPDADAGILYNPAPVDLTSAPYCVPNADSDPTRHYSTTANYPLAGSINANNELAYPFPTDPQAPLPEGLEWDSASPVVNRWDTVLGKQEPGSLVRTLNDVYQYFFTVTNTGGQGLTDTNYDPADDGTGGARASRARHYCDESDPANTIHVLDDGVELDATCDGSGCVQVDSKGPHIFTGLLRVPGVGFGPDKTLNIVAKYGSGPNAWPSLWSWLTAQYSPGTTQLAYQGWSTINGQYGPGPSALYVTPLNTSGTQCSGNECGGAEIELDINDGFFTNGVIGAREMITGAPSFLEDPNAKVTVCKNDGGFSCPYSVPGKIGASGPEAQTKLPDSVDCTANFCNYTMTWSSSSKLVSFYIGQVGQPSVLATQFELDPGLLHSYPSNVGKGLDAGTEPTLPTISIMMSNEAVANFNNPKFPLSVDDGVDAGNGRIRGWGLEIQRISLWDRRRQRPVRTIGRP